MFSAEEALKFLTENREKIPRSSPPGIFRRVIRREERFEKLFQKTFAAPVLVWFHEDEVDRWEGEDIGR